MIIITRLCLIAVCIVLVACKADISVQDEPTDPVVQEIALAFVERPLLVDDERYQSNLFDPSAFNPGARLVLKQNAFAQSAETDLTASLFTENSLYDVKDLAASPDGTTLLFALRAPQLPNVADELQPKWDLWRYDVASKTVSPLITDTQLAQRGHDRNDMVRGVGGDAQMAAHGKLQSAPQRETVDHRHDGLGQGLDAAHQPLPAQ